MPGRRSAPFVTEASPYTPAESFPGGKVSAPIKDRPLTPDEVERMRLALSTFRDGSGQYVNSIRKFMPDYLDFERVTALVCGGTTGEDKGIFDVLVPAPGTLPFGVSCKMAVTQPGSSLCSFMEMSNSKKKFDDEFARLGIDWKTQPDAAGPSILDLVSSWHAALAPEVDLVGSRYLVLAHDPTWQRFQLLCFPLDLRIADPRRDVAWVNEGKNRADNGPSTVAGYIDDDGRSHRLWQLYQNSGGQLKYYPLLRWADWVSPLFELEEPPVHNLKQKVEDYFPGRWPD